MRRREILTPREKEVLRYFRFTVNEIAQMLCVEPTTIWTHVNNIYTKFHAHSRLDAILYALDNGIIDSEDIVK